MRIISALLLVLMLNGCGAVYSWNKAAQSIQTKKANAILLEACEGGNLDACAVLQNSRR